MKSLKKDIIAESLAVGTAASKVAEALQTELDVLYADILLKKEVNAKSLDEAYAKLQKRTERLFSLALREFSAINADISKQATKLINQSLVGAKKLIKIDSQDRVKNYIRKITGDQLRENKTIAYKNGRRIGFKEYTEMATRTRMQHELLDQTKEIGEATMQLFYVCDTYSDCANDHIDYQGKMYYDEKVLKNIPRDNPHYEAIMKGVRKCKSSVERVTNDKPYLVTRPNCRHRLIPISMSDAIDLTVQNVLRKNKADKGNYSESTLKRNYDDSQKQRKIELAIRKHKRNLAIREKAYEQTGDSSYLDGIDRAKFAIRYQQKRMRELMKTNKTLKRDYRRENPYYLQRDLGVAYNTEPIRAGFEVPKEKLQEFTGDMVLEDIKLVKDTGTWVKELSDEEQEVIDEFVVNNKTKDPDLLHFVFAKIKDKDIESDKGLIVYKHNVDLVQENDTTIIANGFMGASLKQTISKTDDEVLYKIIMPPKAQNQALYHKGKIIIDTNSVYDIISEEKVEAYEGNFIKQYTLLLRPKHEGVKR